MMKNMIDLVPYLPQQVAAEKRERREKCVRSIAETIESIVTLCIGAGFFMMLLAFFATMA